LVDKAVETEPREQGQKQEESGYARAEGTRSFASEQPAVGELGALGLVGIGGGPSTWHAGEKGGVRPWRISARNWATRFRSVP
jgi:hypothetical protein